MRKLYWIYSKIKGDKVKNVNIKENIGIKSIIKKWWKIYQMETNRTIRGRIRSKKNY